MKPAGDPAQRREESQPGATGYAAGQLAPLSDVREEGLRLVHAAAERGIPVRLIGGVAVWALGYLCDTVFAASSAAV